MTEDRVEQMARRLAAANCPGWDPNRIVFSGEPTRIGVPGGTVYAWPAPYVAAPLWSLFIHMAQVALSEAGDA